MSYSSLFVIDEDGDVQDTGKEYRNGHGYAMPVWTYLARKYLKQPGEDAHKFWVRWYYEGKIEPVFKLKADPRLERWEWIVLLTSFDHALVKKENFQETIEAFRMLHGQYKAIEPGNVCHYEEMANDIERMIGSPEVTGIGWNATSVSEDLWSVRDDCVCTACGNEHEKEDERHYNVKKDKRHFFVFDYDCPRTFAEAKK